MNIEKNQTYMIPMGGCGEFGKNLTLYVHNQRIFVVDCGIKFADERMLGISGLIPSVKEAFATFGKVEAYLITHGHEDHIGAIPYIVNRWPAPVYCTPWTQRLVERRLQRLNWSKDQINFVSVNAGDTLSFPNLKAEYVHVNHSIPMCCAINLKFPDVTIFHTGDFKIDPSPAIEAKTNFARLAAIGEEGVDYMICDSTSMEIEGMSPGEASVKENLSAVVQDAPGRIYVSTFASNYWRVKSMMEICQTLGKKLYVAGAGFHQTLAMAEEFGWVGPERDCLIEEHELALNPREKTVVLASGSQGEWRSAMYRISHDELPALRVESGDTMVFSSRVIPGNEKNLFQMMSRLRYLGAELITGRSHRGIHVSGHAQRGDVLEYVRQLKPQNFLAVHGTYLQIMENQQLGMEHSTRQTSLLLENGSIVALKERPLPVAKLESIAEFIDQDANIPLDYETMRYRHRLGELGGIVVSGVIGKRSFKWLSPLELDLIGISLMSESANESFIKDLESSLSKSLQNALSQEELAANESDVNEWLRRKIRRAGVDTFHKKVVVLTYVFLV